MGYVINAHDCFQTDDINTLNSDNAKIRNRLFTAMTRSKAWVRVVGVGEQMEALKVEYEKVKEKEFTLDFIYPTEEQRKYLNIVNRDVSNAEKENIARRRKSVADLLQDIEEGRIYVDDLGAEQIERLNKILNTRRSE